MTFDASRNSKMPFGLEISNCKRCERFCTSSANNFRIGVVTCGSCGHNSIARIKIGV